jgi:hypothetical protein
MVLACKWWVTTIPVWGKFYLQTICRTAILSYYNAGISSAVPPVVVQGTYVNDDPYSLELRRQQQPPTAYNHYPTSNIFGEYQMVGEVQPRR